MSVKNEHINHIFERELHVLEQGKLTALEGSGTTHPLQGNYEELVKQYEKLLRLTKKIFKISDLQGKILKKREQEIKHLLNNSNQGFLTFGKEMVVHKEYSVKCVDILGGKVEGSDISHLLCPDDPIQRDAYKHSFQCIFSSISEQERNTLIDELPGILWLNEKSISLEFKWVDDPNLEQEGLIMLILTDITETLEAKDRVEYLSYHDPVTSLFNRAYINVVIPNLFRSAYFPFSVVIADLNGLKLTNDVFGHQTGDELIQQAAQIFSECCSKNDVIARWGGDEFLLLLPSCDQESAEVLIQQISLRCKQGSEMVKLSMAMGSATTSNPTLTFHELLIKAEKQMYKNKLLKSKETKDRMVDSLVDTLESRCYMVEGHRERLRRMGFLFSEYIGISDNPTLMKQLELLVRIHDIGKISIPSEILGKPGKLNEDEWEIVKTHCEIGYRMSRAIGESEVADAILTSHERWDGEGYPFGLNGEQIPLLSRLLAILVTFDVMTHDRVYKQAVSKEEAFEEIRIHSGSQFDPKLVQLFLTHKSEIVCS